MCLDIRKTPECKNLWKKFNSDKVSVLRKWGGGEGPAAGWGEPSLTSLARTRSMDARFHATSLLFLRITSVWRFLAAISTNLLKKKKKTWKTGAQEGDSEYSCLPPRPWAWGPCSCRSQLLWVRSPGRSKLVRLCQAVGAVDIHRGWPDGHLLWLDALAGQVIQVGHHATHQLAWVHLVVTFHQEPRSHQGTRFQ